MRVWMSVVLAMSCWACDAEDGDGAVGQVDGGGAGAAGGEGGAGAMGGEGGAGAMGGEGGAGAMGGEGGAGAMGGEGGAGAMGGEGGAGAMGGEGGAGAMGGEGGGGGECDGPNPQGCFDGGDCESQEVCDLDVDACIPTACECDETGEWTCTPDCGGGRCVEVVACDGENPGGANAPGCVADADCAEGDVCDASDCEPVPCDCVDGEWACINACGGQCAPAGQCAGENPGGDETGGCVRDADCADGEQCDMSECLPLPCACVDGEWLCSDGCAGACLAPAACVGPNPAGCADDTGCAPDQACLHDGDACIPSNCECDDGDWLCDPDCGGGQCVAAPECEGPSPVGCAFDADCGADELCLQDGACRPSSCECGFGGWVCTEDCAGGGLCQRVNGECAGPNPAGCANPTDCGADEACVVDEDVCRSSGCQCDAESGQWLCLRDCGGGACLPN
ncbi:MAG: hypothetical protein ACI9U2_000208 [Bradymonadia bacterium]|jgi:hypothetical protein